MAALNITFPAGVAVNQGSKVTLIGDSGTPLTIPVTDKVVDLGNLAPNWTQVPRPGFIAPAYTVRGPRPLRVLSLTLTLVDPNNTMGSIDTLLTQLYKLVQSSVIVLAYGQFESSSSITASGTFVCTTFDPTIQERHPTTNEAIQATATLELTEANPPPVIANPGPT